MLLDYIEPIHSNLGGGSALIVPLATFCLLQQGHPPTSEQEVLTEVCRSARLSEFHSA